jgi:hypothetical protein
VSKSPLDGSLVAREAVDVGGPGPPGAKAVQADPGDDRRQPAGEVLDGVGVGAGELEPRLLHGVVRLGPAAEHPVGDGAQARPAGLELLGQPVVVHRHRSLTTMTTRTMAM